MSAKPNADSLRVLPAPERYAVLLNARARGWTGEVHEAVQRFVPNRDLFLTDDFHQANTSIERILDGDYDVIFTGGGDGTVVFLINAIEDKIRSGEMSRDEAPPVGVLRLGTGNAIATYMGSGPIIEDLRTLHAGSPLQLREVNMIEDGEHRFPFAGFGWDADILNDYHQFKANFKDSALEPVTTGMGGYAMSIATKTLPKALARGSKIATFTNLGEEAFELDEEGQVVREFGAGEILYRGPIKITSPASIPYWGFNVRMFPYCNLRPGMFELRYYKGSVARVIANLRGFWRGHMPASTIGDWLVSSVRIDIEDGPMSYQVAGDAAGLRDSVEWTLADHGAQLAVPLR